MRSFNTYRIPMLSGLAVAGLVALSVSCNGSGASGGVSHGVSDAAVDTVMDEEALVARMGVTIRECLNADSTEASQSITRLIGSIHDDASMLSVADSLADLYLYNPMSPVRNEEQYIIFLREILRCDSLPEHIRLRDIENLRLVSLNRPGMIANDFRFIDRDGVTATLQSLFDTGDDRQLLLVFYDPECTHCTEILESLARDAKIISDIEGGYLRVLAVYTEGNRDLWERTKGEMPAQWRVACDLSGIVDKELYDIPAMPSLYLLDSTGRVVLKDPPV